MTATAARIAAVLALACATALPAVASGGARYVMHAGADHAAPEGEKPKTIVSVTSAVRGRRYFLRLSRTSRVKQPDTGAECRDGAATVIGVTATTKGVVTFPPQPGGPYQLGAAHLCPGSYRGTVLEQRAGRGTRVVRRFMLSVPGLKLATVRS